MKNRRDKVSARRPPSHAAAAATIGMRSTSPSDLQQVVHLVTRHDDPDAIPRVAPPAVEVNYNPRSALGYDLRVRVGAAKARLRERRAYWPTAVSQTIPRTTT